MPGTVPTALNTTITDFIATTLFGIVMTLVIQKLSAQGYKVNQKVSMSPAMKPIEPKNDEEKHDEEN